MSPKAQSKTNTLYPPFVSIILILIGISCLNTCTSLLLTAKGYNSTITGIVYSAYYAGIMAGTFYAKKMIHIKGHRGSYIFYAISTSIIIGCWALSSNPLIWAIYRFLSGLTLSGVFIVLESWLLIQAAPKTRGLVLSFYMFSIYSAECIGQFGISLLEVSKALPFLLASVLAAVSVIPLLKGIPSTTSYAKNQETKYLDILNKTPFGLLGAFAGGLILGAFFAMGPVYAKNTGLSLMQISSFMAIPIIGGMAMQWPLGKASDRFERKHILLIQSAVISVSSIYIAITPHPILLFLYGGFSFTLYPVSIAYCCDFFTPSSFPDISSAILNTSSFGFIIGPILSSLCMKAFGMHGLFYFSAMLCAFVILFSISQNFFFSQKHSVSK